MLDAVVLFIFSTVLTFIIYVVSKKKNLLAHVNERSSHSIATPHGGGIAIAVAWFIGLSVLFVNQDIDENLFYALLSGIILSVVSYLDDLFELSARLRLVVQSSVAIFALYMINGVSFFDLAFIDNIIAFIIIIWSINLYNFLDGIDGYAAQESIFLGFTLYILFGSPIFLVLVASVAGFLVWNWHPAKIFMGDVGSTLLGFNIAVLALYFGNENIENFFIFVLLYSFFWIDATVTLLRRLFNKEKLTIPHKKHYYQRFTQIGLKHNWVSFGVFILNIAVFFIFYKTQSFLWSFFFVFAVFVLISYYLEKRKPFV